MSIVNTTKARAWADSLNFDADGNVSADWIRELADEVESLQRHADRLGRQIDAHIADLEQTRTERDQALAGLRELYERIGAMLAEARLIVDHHPDPAASAAAMRIMREDKS